LISNQNMGMSLPSNIKINRLLRTIFEVSSQCVTCSGGIIHRRLFSSTLGRPFHL
jgi:hypothetical protein